MLGGSPSAQASNPSSDTPSRSSSFLNASAHPAFTPKFGVFVQEDGFDARNFALPEASASVIRTGLL